MFGLDFYFRTKAFKYFPMLKLNYTDPGLPMYSGRGKQVCVVVVVGRWWVGGVGGV